MCKKYSNAQKDANCKYTPSDKLSIEELVGKLATGASQITEKWRTQRNHKEYIDNLC
jgi:hypothetical protein